MSQMNVIEFLSDPRSYGPGVRSVGKCETHGSIVFLADERAYKLKRAVRFPYMDYSTVGERQRMCERELEVNRRTAPMLYLEVLAIIRSHTGSLCFGTEANSGSALDWVVVMRRFDQEALLEQMRVSGALTRPLMRLLAEGIAEFHRKAEVTPDFGGATGIRAAIEENTAILGLNTGRPFGAELVARYKTEATSLLASVGSLLEERRRQGRVRRCHGDLHLNNICMIDSRPVLFDTIEFSDEFSCIDIFYDLAFLLMDLDRHGLRGHANILLNRYLEETGEHSGLAALPLFLSCRAAIRAHTALAAADASNDENVRKAQQRHSVQLLELAVTYLAKCSPRLVAVGGVSGTGKSRLARDLAPLSGAPPGAVVIRSDIIRLSLKGSYTAPILVAAARLPCASLVHIRFVAFGRFQRLHAALQARRRALGRRKGDTPASARACEEPGTNTRQHADKFDPSR
jgi:uncharacterized protein